MSSAASQLTFLSDPANISSMQKMVKISVLAFWLIMIGLLVDRNYMRAPAIIAHDVVIAEGVRTQDEWFGIYQQGRKIGYAHTRITPEADAYHIYEESELDVLVLGSVQRIATTVNIYSTNNFLLKYFDFSLKSDMTAMNIKGAVVKKQLVLDITTGGQTRKERVPLRELPYLTPIVKPALLLQGLEMGKKYRFPVFNPATMNTDDSSIIVEAKEQIKIGDSNQTVYKLREQYQGMEAVSWITPEGETIKEESPLGYVLLKETMTEARKRDKQGPAIDIIDLTMIPSDPIRNSKETKNLKARLKGIAVQGFNLDNDRQKLSGDIIEIQVPDHITSYRLPYVEHEHREQLRSTALIQSDHPKIKDQVAKILSGERDAREAARKLNEWVFSAIQKKPVVSIPSALEVLAQHVGDCNEHTALYTALARASGIPTRMAAGIVYSQNGFFYHAWPEVWLGAWVAIDPTFNQFPADATHIRFVTGDLDQQAAILKLIGKLKVEVLEYK